MTTDHYEAVTLEETDDSVGEVALLPHYVYILLNPLNGNTPFYIGKGTGTRVKAHFQEFKKDFERRLEEETADPQRAVEISPAILDQKKAILQEIWDNQKRPLELVIGRFKTHEEAFAVEAVLMHFVFDHDQLANRAGGKGRKYIRTKKEFLDILTNAESQDDIEHLPGIDMPIKKNVHDGAYSNEQIANLSRNGTYEKLDALKANLAAHGFEYRDFSKPDDRKFDPNASTGNLGAIVNICGIDFGLEIRATNRIKVSVYGTEATCTDASSALLNDMSRNFGLSLSEPNIPFRGGGWKYKNIKGLKKFTEFSELLDQLNAFKTFLQDRAAA